MSKECFGMFTFFSVNASECKECENQKECSVAVLKELEDLSGVDGIEKIIKRHQKKMTSIGVITEKTHVLSSKKTNEKKTNVLEITLSKFSADGITDKGFINSDISNAPDYFQTVVRFIKVNEKVSQEAIVKDLQLKIPDLNGAMQKAALALQVLVANGIVVPKGKKIVWVGSTKNE